MSSALAVADRRPLDAYYTPDALASALVGVLPIAPVARVLEPHAGGGAFVRALVGRGVGRVLAADVDPCAPIFLDPPRTGVTLCPGCDFLGFAWNDIDWIVGNPPFRGLEAHVEHALTLAPNVAFLLRLAVMESKGRVPLWQTWPLRHVWVLAERPSFTDGGTDSAAYGFFWFQRGSTTPTITPGWSWK